MDGLACCPPRSIHVVARLDIPGIVTPGADLDNEDVIIDHLGAVVDIINTRVAGTDGQCLFTGLLLAGFAKHFRPAVVNELARLIGDMGLDLWLELSHPEYLTEGEACSIDMGLIQGLVYRNGMIGPDGGWQSFFQMTAMRTVMRAVAAQRVAHSIPLVMWETVGDTVELEYATLARAHRLYGMSPVEQTLLALNVVSSVLQLRLTMWCSVPWNSTTIKFPVQAVDGARAALCTPYVEQAIDPTMLGAQEGAYPELTTEAAKVTMLELAILLLEILHHKSIAAWAARHEEGNPRTYRERMGAATRWLELSTSKLLPSHVKAVEECLVLCARSKLSWDDYFQRLYCENIIKPLQELVL